MRNLLLSAIAAGTVALASACGEPESRDQVPPTALTESGSPQPTQAPPATQAAEATPDNTPMPRHVNFAPGEVIDTGGQAGVVFVDPATGLAEGWLLAGVPANYSFSLGSSDGHLLLYRCQHPGGWTSPAGCDPPNAWYLFDTRTGHRVRFDMFSDAPPPVVIGPEGDELLGVTATGAILVSTVRPDQSRNIDVPAGYQLLTPTALWNRDGTDVIVSAFHPGTPQCGYGSGSFPQYACGTTPMLWQTLLIDRSSGAETQLGDKRSSFAWSPDGSEFAIARAIERAEGPSEIAVYSRDGKLLWSQPRYAFFPNLNWSPDGSSIGIQVLSRPEPVAGAMRLDVLDAETGATRYRIVGAIACEGRLWTADGARLILLGAYGFERSVVADPRDKTLRGLSAQLSPSPTEPDIAYAYEGAASVGTTGVNIDSGETRQIASFPFPMASTTLSGGTRFAFIATLAGGRGGCAEAIEYVDPPTTHFEYPPFTD